MRRIAMVLMVAVIAGSAFAQPAPWHTWKSKLDGKEVCAQTSPGHGWEWASGPYRDLNCTQPGRPGER